MTGKVLTAQDNQTQSIELIITKKLIQVLTVASLRRDFDHSVARTSAGTLNADGKFTSLTNYA